VIQRHHAVIPEILAQFNEGEEIETAGAVKSERLIKGLKGPIALAVSGDTLFVVSSGYTAAGAGGVREYNAESGAVGASQP
jgi:hypothetical protein